MNGFELRSKRYEYREQEVEERKEISRRDEELYMYLFSWVRHNQVERSDAQQTQQESCWLRDFWYQYHEIGKSNRK